MDQYLTNSLKILKKHNLKIFIYDQVLGGLLGLEINQQPNSYQVIEAQLCETKPLQIQTNYGFNEGYLGQQKWISTYAADKIALHLTKKVTAHLIVSIIGNLHDQNFNKRVFFSLIVFDKLYSYQIEVGSIDHFISKQEYVKAYITTQIYLLLEQFA